MNNIQKLYLRKTNFDFPLEVDFIFLLTPPSSSTVASIFLTTFSSSILSSPACLSLPEDLAEPDSSYGFFPLLSLLQTLFLPIFTSRSFPFLKSLSK